MTRATRQRLLAVADRTPLRVKLVAGLLILAAIGLFAAGFASLAYLERYLLRQIDDQLGHSADAVVRMADSGIDGHNGPLDRPGSGWGNGPGPRERPALAVPFYSMVFTSAGKPVGNDDGLKTPDSQGSHAPPQLPDLSQPAVRELADRPFTVRAIDGNGEWRVLATQTRDGHTVVVALALQQVNDTIGHVKLAEIGVGLLVLVALGLLGYVSVNSSLRPLMRVEATAAAIAAGDLSRRVPAGNTATEVGRLANALNAMLAQIEAAFSDREAAAAAARSSEAAARESETAARASEERMRRFVADASHELRTPLTTIRGFAELLRHQLVIDPGKVSTTTGRIEAAATRMTSLVEDLLLLARLDQQRPLARQPVDLLAVVTDAVIDFQVTAAEHPLTLHVTDDGESPPPVVFGDEPRLRQVVANLLANAGTHTPSGTEVSVELSTEGDQAVLTVADTGPGIAPEMLERLFERFYRADTSRTRASGGTGLGLSIVAALVAAQGGTVRVASEPGVGTRFEVRLPLHRSS